LLREESARGCFSQRAITR